LKVDRWARKYREESTMSNEQAAPETKGVAAELLAKVDLGPEIEGMAGRQLRMRMVTIEPGGVFGPIHDHKDRPGRRTYPFAQVAKVDVGTPRKRAASASV
jgi:hypothetical protein